jgi:hypothetical protein
MPASPKIMSAFISGGGSGTPIIFLHEFAADH